MGNGRGALVVLEFTPGPPLGVSSHHGKDKWAECSWSRLILTGGSCLAGSSMAKRRHRYVVCLFCLQPCFQVTEIARTPYEHHYSTLSASPGSLRGQKHIEEYKRAAGLYPKVALLRKLLSQLRSLSLREGGCQPKYRPDTDGTVSADEFILELSHPRSSLEDTFASLP